ncbi:hypothetical protein EST38_g12400 [Candolleomyces aberdarensis]|uniref:Uncharacterized protein n=1 Tax=Candolleomyces aberdarensis TaxID=2316362 RepID=A0A4Q2D534_9AGAR|nr:hypothetical protein EST38_g12400 [Candolleomyces aberdarensis]
MSDVDELLEYLTAYRALQYIDFACASLMVGYQISCPLCQV